MAKNSTNSGDNWELAAVRAQLKLILKQKKFSYQAIAKELGISEVTVKRFFTSEDISFSKLQQICRVIGISVIDLVAVVKEAGEQSFQLTFPQEKALSENESLYDFFVSLLKYKSVKQATQRVGLPKENIPSFLRQLDHLGLIEIPIGDKVSLKVQGVLTWLRGGPLQKKFMRSRHLKYLDAFERSLDDAQYFLTSSQRRMLPSSLEEMKRDLEFVAQKYRSRAYREETIHDEEQLVAVAWLVGLGKYDPRLG
jgi:DNA-binding Xre family transcriptional regulator